MWDGSSKPIASASLEIYLDRGEERELLSTVETLEDGSFACPSPRLTEMTAIERATAGIVVRGSSNGIARRQSHDLLPEEGDVHLDVIVDRRWASGRVIGRSSASPWPRIRDLTLLDPERSFSEHERTARVDATTAGADERLERSFCIPGPSCGGTIAEIGREGVYRSDTVFEPGAYVFGVNGAAFEEARAVAVLRSGEVSSVRMEVH